MKKLITLCLMLLAVNAAVKAQGISLATDPNATKETQALYNYLFDVQKNYTMLGHHDGLAYGHGWRDNLGKSDVKQMTGSQEAVCGLDFGKIEHGHEININRVPFDKMREIVKYAYRQRQVIMICWHVDNPMTYQENLTYPVGTSWDNSSNDVVREILKDGSVINLRFKGWMDNLAGYIKTLKDDDGTPIPFIFRPWHEHTQAWNWWGKKCATEQEFIDLWRFTITYLRDHHDIHNMIYSISPQMDTELTKQDYLFRWPGDEYVDFLGMDCYHGRNKEAFAVNVKNISELSQEKKKPCAVTETGIEGVKYPTYFTEEVLPALKGNQLSFVMFWRNDDEMKDHHFLPFKGDVSEKDFVKFCKDSKVLLLKDLRKVGKY